MPMPNRNLKGDYRYAYQGQEVDPETGKEAFQLRLWDSRIGRWLTTDPYGQYASPYLGMGNNPINAIDPDGGYSGWWGALGGWIAGGFKGSIESNSNAATDSHKYYINKTGDGSNGILIDFGNIKSDLLASGKYWRPDGQGKLMHTWSFSQKIPTTADNWAEGNFAQQAAYSTANAFSVVGQSMNPFDNQVTTLRGEDISDHDRGGYGAEVAGTLLPIGSAKIAAGPIKQWVRLGSSYSHHLGAKTANSIRWGASPANKGKYLKMIPSTTFRKLNQWLRGKKLPGNNWRVKDPGHFHLKL